MSSYIFDSNAEEREFRRLQLIESANDPTTIALLKETDIQSGWHCLEMGAGAGSILRWLGEQVGPTGLAIGVDKKTTYLQDFHTSPFQIYESTFLEVLLEQLFHLIHGRYVLIHNQEDMAILRKMFALLKPGGWAVFEEPDFTSTTLLHQKKETPQARVNLAICQMFVNMGLRVRQEIPGTIGRPRFVIGARRDEGASRDDVTEEQRRPGPKMGLPVGPRRFWTAPASLVAPILPVCTLFAPWLAPKSSRPIAPGIS